MNLEAQLSEVFSRYISERKENGTNDYDLQDELKKELKKTISTLSDIQKSLSSGLVLTSADTSVVDLDEILKNSKIRAKNKKLRLEGNEMVLLQGKIFNHNIYRMNLFYFIMYVINLFFSLY